MTTTAWTGAGDLSFELDPDWLKMPDHWTLGNCTAVAVDSNDHVWLAACGDHAVSVWTSDGALAGIWPPDDLSFPHGLATTPHDDLLVVDTVLHAVRRYDHRGSLTLQLGQPHRPTACVTHDGRLGGPFNMPTAAAADADGRIFVADGYGNRQVHRFSATGELEMSWGTPGDRPGEFAVVHGICISPRGEIVVADRENHRIQFFDPDGEFIRAWTGLMMPAAVAWKNDLVYITEMGTERHTQPNGLSIFTQDGECLGRWYGPETGSLTGPHGIAVDHTENVYVTDMAGSRIVKLCRV